MKKRTYIIKIGIRFQCATTDREEACLRCQHLEAHGKNVHLWSRPYRGSPDQLVEEDFWADGADIPTVEPEPPVILYTVMRDGAEYYATSNKSEADAICNNLNADGCEAKVVET